VNGSTRQLRLDRPVLLSPILGLHRRGGGDPTHRRLGDIWLRTTRTPAGPALIKIIGQGNEVAARAWGEGAEWALDQLPRLVGEADDPGGFSPLPEHRPLVEAERRFVLTAEYRAMDNQPFVAFNKAQSIFHDIQNEKSGDVQVGQFDSTAIHRKTFKGDEGRRPVTVRGTQLWPAEASVEYGYDDLRCAYKFAEDVLLVFGEPRDASMATKSLTLRHLMSWLPGGYNARGCTIDGVLRALKDVVAAYGTDKSDVMRGPSVAPKADE